MGISNNGINCNSTYSQQSYVKPNSSNKLKYSAAMYSNSSTSNDTLRYLIGDQNSNTKPKKRDALSFLGLKPGDILKNVLAIQSTKSTTPIAQTETGNAVTQSNPETNNNQGFLSLTMSGKS